MKLAPLAIILSLAACSSPTPGPVGRGSSAVDDPLQAFLDAFRAERYPEALERVDGMIETDPLDGNLHAYRATCLTMMDSHEEAVEAYLHGELLSPDFRDSTVLYLRALSLYHLSIFSRAREELDTLAAAFPRSQASEKGQDLAIRIESKLGEGVEGANLNWYLDRGLGMQAAARPALAAEYLEEYLLLAARARESVTGPGPRLALGAAYLELAAPREALIHLEKVPPERDDYRASLFLALAHHSLGNRDRAREVLTKAAGATKSAAVREQAEALAQEWSESAE